MAFLQKLLGDPNARQIARLQGTVEQINALEPEMQKLSDEELRGKTVELRTKLAAGRTLDDLLPEAFALVRQATWRTQEKRQFDVQLTGGIALHQGSIAEMRTGEGKTHTALAPVYLNALTGKGVHVVTVNDYLSRRDTVWMGQVYHALGLSVGCIQHGASFLYDPSFKQEVPEDVAHLATEAFRVDMDYLRPVSRKEAYAADITYGTNNEFGFDYLRDNMAPTLADMVQRELHYAVVDEVDSILIDEARTPLIISAPAQEAADIYYRFAELVSKLVEKDDYQLDEKLRVVTLTEGGITKMEQFLGVENLYAQGGMRTVHHVEQALKAHALFKKDRDYVVKDGEVMIVDEFTGRLMIGRRYSEGLHQAIEAKESVAIQRESVTLATITFQNYFRLYEKLAGMTGTAVTEAEEFFKIYKLDVLSIPTNKKNQRVDLPDRVYKTEIGKYRAVAREIKERSTRGQPVLVGTVSIEKNELLSEILKQEGVAHNVLNAKNHEHEAEIIAQAGRKGAVTVATNMAGRGVDIILGGQPVTQEEGDEVRALGGLHVIGTERHESRRIDNQLRGRSGRQGDPGATQFYVSTEDDLMRIFAADRMRNIMERVHLPEDEPIENRLLSRIIEAAQHKIEGHNFDIRKHVLEYDDVLNKHRTAIYRKRRELLDLSSRKTENGERPLKPKMLEIVEAEIAHVIAFHTAGDDLATWDVEKIEQAVKTILPESMDIKGLVNWPDPKENEREDLIKLRSGLIGQLMEFVCDAYKSFEETIGDQVTLAEIEKAVLLRSMDDLWIEHLETMEHLRHGVNLQAYGQRDPLVEYKKEAYHLFQTLLAAIDQQVATTIFKVRISRSIAEEEANRLATMTQAAQFSGPVKEINTMPGANGQTKQVTLEKVGRNDLCPCGSGKKFKKCHGA